MLLGPIFAHGETFEKIHSRGPVVNRQRELFLPPIVLDRGSSTPLRIQVVRHMASAIQSGAPRGSRLPSTRVLARLLGVSRNTVMAAYDDLVAAGLVSGRRGAGMLVAAGPSRGVHAFDLQHVLRQAQYPMRTIGVADPDGNQLYMSIH